MSLLGTLEDVVNSWLNNSTELNFMECNLSEFNFILSYSMLLNGTSVNQSWDWEASHTELIVVLK